MDKTSILVMDDEESVRNVTSNVLAHVGYNVTTAIEGGEAVKLYREAMESGHPYDVVMLDLQVPQGMGGKEAIRKLKEIDPYVKALVFSGYYDEPVMAYYRKYGFKEVISKPYQIDRLIKVLHRMIAES